MLTGVLLGSLARQRHSDGIRLCNNGDVLLAATHLYYACRSSGALQIPWPDMEFFIEQHGAQKLGLKNTNNGSPALASAKFYGLAFGAELREYAKRARRMATGGLSGISRVPLPSKLSPVVRERCVSIADKTVTVGTPKSNMSRGSKFDAALYEVVNIMLH